MYEIVAGDDYIFFKSKLKNPLIVHYVHIEENRHYVVIRIDKENTVVIKEYKDKKTQIIKSNRPMFKTYNKQDKGYHVRFADEDDH